MHRQVHCCWINIEQVDKAGDEVLLLLDGGAAARRRGTRAGEQLGEAERLPDHVLAQPQDVVLYGFGRIGSALSVLDFVHAGSTLSVRSFMRTGSSLSAYGILRRGSNISMLDYLNLGSSFSIRSYVRLGSSVSCYGLSRLGSSLSTLDFVNFGSSCSMRNVARIGSGVSIFSQVRLGSSVSVLDFNTFVCTTCSGIHRELQHRIKGVAMSTFTTEEIKALDNDPHLYVGRWLEYLQAGAPDAIVLPVLTKCDFVLPAGKPKTTENFEEAATSQIEWLKQAIARHGTASALSTARCDSHACSQPPPRPTNATRSRPAGCGGRLRGSLPCRS